MELPRYCCLCNENNVVFGAFIHQPATAFHLCTETLPITVSMEGHCHSVTGVDVFLHLTAKTLACSLQIHQL